MFKNTKIQKIYKKFFLALGVLSIIFGGLSYSFFTQISKPALAALVYQCGTGETLSGTNCSYTPVGFPIYSEACPTGYTPMDYTCVTFTQQTCADYTGAEVDTTDNTMCKLTDPSSILLTGIRDSDGRQCKGSGYNFKQYAVGLALTVNTGPIVCANTFTDVAQKPNFRFIPRTITSIKDFVTTQTGVNQVCPAGYTLSSNLCTIPAFVSGCGAAGEYFDTSTSTCKTCLANKYCPNTAVGQVVATVCANGATLTGGLCIASNKISATTYVDGCTSEHVRFDKTCAIEETRTHDLGCSYFYASENANIVAVLDADGIHCSTGGSVDFANSSIVKVSDLECDGPGSGWYNYNVSYDPLVCGNSYDPNNKAAFRWLEKTFLKITGLQKLGSTITQCPPNWTAVASTENCSQNALTRTVALVVDCPTNQPYSPQGSSASTSCTANQTATNNGGGVIRIVIVGSISGYVYVDLNNNGIADAGENGIAGVKIDLIPETPNCGTLAKSTVTDQGGKYEFKDLESCVYSVVEVQPTAYVDGLESVGKIDNVTIGSSSQNDKITGISINGNNSIYNNFGETPICKLKADEYLENKTCKPCPANTVVKSSNPTSIADCIVVEKIVPSSTVRTGGLELFDLLVVFLALSTATIAFIIINTNRKEFISGWFKAK
jgi:SdrD B-like domain